MGTGVEIQTEPVEASYRLSPMQEGMLFHSLYARETGVDITQILCDLHEEIDVPALEAAWQQITDHHAVLRARFRWDGLDEPRQEVQRNVRIVLRTKDWRGLPKVERSQRLESLLQAERHCGFNLTAAPLMRLALIRLGPAEWQFIWTFHHLLLDARSFVVVLNDVFAAYAALKQGRELTLPKPRPYRDYINWLQQQDFGAAEPFWRQMLGGFTTPTPLALGPATTRAWSGEEAYGEQEIRLSETATQSLRELARQNDLTLNTLVQGAWALLLSRYSGETDVVFGATRAGRRGTVAGAESMVGLFINTVPVRVRLPPDARLLPWLQELRAQWRAMHEYEHTPLARIQGWSDAPRGVPLFESILNVQDPSWDAVLRGQGGSWLRREFRIRNQTNYPLALDVYGGQDLRLKIIYDRRRFPDGAMSPLLGHLRTLFEGMAANPNQRLAELPLLTEAERRQVLVEWNRTEADYPQDQCIHELVETQVERTPDALAVAFGEQKLSYRELNARANQLAHRLQQAGVGPEKVVGLCLERSADLVIGVLGILKAGGAYVPLDPAYPAERLAFMLEDAQVSVVVTHETLRPKLPPTSAEVICLGVDDPSRITHHASLADAPSGNPRSAATPKNLAYVIYTSGSTGVPKGVEVQHGGLVNLVAWHQRTYQVTAADRATQMASPAFDAAAWEIWPYLAGGASLHIPDDETRLSQEHLLEWLRAHQITLCFLPTPLAEAVLDRPWPEGLALRALLTGGDRLKRRPKPEFPCALVNHYGPTESTVVATCAPVAPGTDSEPMPPIGRPIANTQVYVLDRHGQPVPIGVPGELHIGGVGLARGYRRRPELTAEKFVPNPFSAEPGARLYKTGDLVRCLPDGNIEFLGRLDHQVKIRGFRIEPGEIESAMAGHPLVREAVVIAHPDPAGETRLIAYVAPAPGQQVMPAELREFLQRKLPDYMVPAAFVLLESLPVTPNGKIDRQALPAPDMQPAADRSASAPRTPTEEVLAGIWCEVLHLTQVDVHKNFFALGGHSLLATQVISRVRGLFQAELPVRALFEAPTIAGLAEKIDALNRAAHGIQAQALPPIHHQDELTLSFAQERLWFLEQLEPGQAFNNVPVALRLKGPLNLGALEQSLTEILRRHKVLRTTFAKVQGKPVASPAPPCPFSVPVEDLSAADPAARGAKARHLAAEEARQPMDLSRSPLLRTRLLRLGTEDHLLVLVLHHSVSDGWSMGVFHRELAALYEAFSQGRPSPLPELPIDYADFAAWQRQWLQGEVLEDQLAYWKRQLGGKLPALDLPTDRPRPPLQTFRGAVKSFALGPELTAALKALSRREEVTLFMTLLAAFQTLLHRHTGQEDLLVGSPIAGRTRTETEGLIGLFLNTLVLRTDLSGDPTFRELLKRVRQVALEAYAHQDLPFEKLVDALQPERDLSRPPLFQVMFTLQNLPLQPLELAGLNIHPTPLDSGTAKFDLTLTLAEQEGGLAGAVEYNTDLFDEPTIGRLIGHLQTLLEGVTANPDDHISRVPILPEAERHQVLLEWNDTYAEVPKDKCVHHLFEEQAARTPEAVAVIFADQQLTYRELNARANQLARQLQGAGVGPDARVGICVTRSLEMMIGLLGILKAGGAYVPMDPAYPAERLAFMLEDAQLSVLLTQKKLADLLPPHPAKVICLDSFVEETAAEATAQASSNPQSAATPDHLAYVIYTSGSTGKPKGVMVRHRNVANIITATDAVIGPEPGVWLAVTSISFDISVVELFWTLARGFKVVIQGEEGKASGQAQPPEQAPAADYSIAAQISRHGVTHLQCTPTLASMMIQDPKTLRALRGLRKFLLGGEALSAALIEQLTGCGEIFNMYGPTETTVWSTAHPVSRAGSPVAIGRPIANTEIYLLDRRLQPVPIGVPGELFIGGAGVARGYLNREELTAERFIPHPFSAQPGARLYRTGDLARYWPDGTIEFLGRLDHQVKLRGFRIELGEIEAALRQYPAVRECVVAVREVAANDQRLVGYVVPQPDTAPAALELRHFLQKKLPDYMVPATFVMLAALPLTPNGKVDRKALPGPEAFPAGPAAGYEPAQTRLEKSIASLWQELLHVESVGLNHNFFDLGGHSLLVVQLHARLCQMLHLDIPVIKLFQYPTIHSFTQFLSEEPKERVSPRSIHQRARRQQQALGLGRNSRSDIAL